MTVSDTLVAAVVGFDAFGVGAFLFESWNLLDHQDDLPDPDVGVLPHRGRTLHTQKHTSDTREPLYRERNAGRLMGNCLASTGKIGRDLLFKNIRFTKADQEMSGERRESPVNKCS